MGSTCKGTAVKMPRRFHSLFQKRDMHTLLNTFLPKMMESDYFTDNVDATVDAEFDYEPIDFRLPSASSPTKSHSHVYEYTTPHHSHEYYHHHQHIMYNGVNEMLPRGFFPSPIIRRQDQKVKLASEAPDRDSIGSDAQQSGQPMNCHSGYSFHDGISRSFPSPPKLLSQSHDGLTAPGPSDTAQQYHPVDHDGRFYPFYKPSDRWTAHAYATSFQQSAHPSPPLSLLAVGASSSLRSPQPSSTASSFLYPTSDMTRMNVEWNVQPLAASRSGPRGVHQESDVPWRGQDVNFNLQNSLRSPSNEIEVESSSMSPNHRQGDAVNCHPSSIQSFNYAGTHQSQSHASPPNHKTMLVATYSKGDVLCGRGGATNSHAGNRKFRKIVALHRERYLRAKKRDKPSYAQYVLGLVRNQNKSKPCRFLKKDPNSDMWYDIGDEKAREKVAQALREGAAQLRRDRQKNENNSSGSGISSASGGIGMSRSACADEPISNKKQKRTIVEIEVVNGARLGGGHSEKDPSDISSNQSTAVVNDRRDDSEGRLLSTCSTSAREGSEEISIPFGLSDEERSLYLTTFLPPRSQLNRGPRSGKQMIIRVR